MKKLSAICLIAAVATSLVSAVPVADNLWDVSGGTAAADDGAFNNFQSAGAEQWIQLQRTPADILGSSKSYSVYNGVGSGYGRSFDNFSLFLGISEFALIYGKDISSPYISIDGEGALLAQHIPASPIIVQEF